MVRGAGVVSDVNHSIQKLSIRSISLNRPRSKAVLEILDSDLSEGVDLFSITAAPTVVWISDKPQDYVNALVLILTR